MRRFMGKIAAGALALMVAWSAVPAYNAVTGTQMETAVEAAETAWNFGGGSAKTQLATGTYQVKIKMQNASRVDLEADDYFSDQYTSMAGTCINGPATLIVHEDGTASVTVNLQAVTIQMGGQNITAWASDWYIYQGFENYTSSEKEAAVIAGTTSENQVNKIRFDIPDTSKNGVYISVNSAGKISDAAFAIDWKNATKVQETSATTAAQPTTTTAQATTTQSSVTKVTAPAKVKGLKVKNVKKKSVKITWKKVTGATGYKVYRKQKNGKYKLVKTIKKNSTVKYINKKLKKNKKYYYKVRAYKTTGKKMVQGKYSVVKSVKIKK